ncbi:hypothetical protein K32_42210 [Kaistia sp. 32K]|nr:hypothetical protein K32_42210 [Kaistia sp. 32K]
MPYRKPTTQRKRLEQGSDGLLERCQQHMQKATYPKTARDLVDLWYGDWWGRKDKPSSMVPKARGWHVDRVTEWLKRHEKAGRLRVVDHNGKWNTRRYLQVDGANWRRGKTTVTTPTLGENLRILDRKIQVKSDD